jgi:acyl-CoA thioesterase FadM
MFSLTRKTRIEWGDCDPAGIILVDCGRSSFKIEHRLTHDGALAVEGFETRVWVGRDADDPTRIKSKPIPPQVVARLTHGSLVTSR